VQILSTLIRADAGQMSVAGHDLVTEPDSVRAAIGVTGQFSAVDMRPIGEPSGRNYTLGRTAIESSQHAAALVIGVGARRARCGSRARVGGGVRAAGAGQIRKGCGSGMGADVWQPVTTGGQDQDRTADET
jgi:hypothetical protein